MSKNEHNENIRTKAIRSKRIAWLLRMEGFEILEVRPDRHKPQYDVYLFEIVPGFQEKLDRIMEKAKKKNY